MILTLVAIATLHRQALKLPSVFSDNMVLQRDVAIPFFGSANPNEAVSVQLNGQTATCTASPNGRWMLKLPALQAGGPFTAYVQSSNTTAEVKNVMVGEVWLCSGQSNMELTESAADDYSQALEEANPAVRMFTVAQRASDDPIADAKGTWVPATKHSIGAFSAVAWSFGRELQNHLNVPIGLINASWGGTRAEAWTSRDALIADPTLKPIVDSYLEELKDFPAKFAAFKIELKEWIASRSDTGNEGFLNGWENRNVDDASWHKVNLPGTIDTMEPSEEGQPFDGAAWFRRTFVLPDGWTGKALRLELGPIADYDDAYVNGTKVGFTKMSNQDAARTSRSYRIAPGILLQGENSIAVRVYASQGACGFTGMDDQMRIVLDKDDSDDPVALAGEWKERVERKLDTTVLAPHMPLGPGSPRVPGSLFNGLIAPLVPFGIKGVIWYQGESNVGEADRYKLLFQTLIRDWRQHWGAGQFPFYFVQLPNYKARKDEPSESSWAELREAQAAALKLNFTGMATTIDLGNEGTIHPKNKREVGRRLALIALSRDYGEHVPYSGPMYHYLSQNGVSIRVFFQHVEDGLKTDDGKAPTGFAIAGDDHRFYWADARIEGTSIVLSNANVPHPVAVRYLWADNPKSNLRSLAGLPAIPFRTDDWSGTGGQ